MNSKIKIILLSISGMFALLFVLYASLSSLVNKGFDISGAMLFLLLIGVGVVTLFAVVKR